MTPDVAAVVAPTTDRFGRLDVARVVRRADLRGPWQWRDLSRLVLGHAIGFVLIAMSWWNTRGDDDIRRQLRWLCLGVAGLILGGVASAVFFMRGRMAVGAARVDLLPDVPAVGAKAPVADEAGPVVSGPGMTRYHRPSCAMVAGREVSAVRAMRGRHACEVCEP